MSGFGLSTCSADDKRVSSYALTFHDGQNLEQLEQKKICPTRTGDFLKSHEISPDGRKALTASESNFMGVWSLPENLLQELAYYQKSDDMDSKENFQSENCIPDETMMSEVIPLGEAIHDFKWYPHMRTVDPSSCCFVACSRDHPIQLWDSNTGQLRASYVAHNHLDELESSNCVAFNLDGTKIFCGANRMIRCFDLSYPGKECTSMATSRSKKHKSGQKGIISEIRFNPQQTEVYAAGSYSHSIGLYSENQASASKSCLLQISDLEHGVTCLRWSPCGQYLWSGGRKSDSILCFDIRNTCQEVGRISRRLSTNQRMQFSLDLWGNTLATGSEDGDLLIYDTTSFELLQNQSVSNNCLNCVSFHPYSSLLFSTTGQRNFDLDDNDSPIDIEATEKWSELQIHGLVKNSLILQQWQSAFLSPQESSND